PSKGEAGPVAVDGVLDALAGAIQLQAKASRVEFSFQSESSLYADVRPEALKFALLNLISYAIDALAEKRGSVVMRISRGAESIELEVQCSESVLQSSNEALRLCSDLMRAAGGSMQTLEPQAGDFGSTVTLHVPP